MAASDNSNLQPASVPAGAPASIHDGQRDPLLLANSKSSQNSVSTLNKKKESPWRLWRWELGGLVLSIASMAAVIAILIWIDQRSLASWRAPISLNTSIALLATVSQTAMLLAVAEGVSQLKWIYFQQRAHRLSELQLFDDASRGPWGALKLMWRIRWRAAVASGGAAITLLALAMQSFTQQAVALPKRSVLAANYTASMYQALNFDTNRPLTAADIPSSAEIGFSYPLTKIYDISVNDAIYSGIFAPELQVGFHCLSGNCTWESTTLGVCSQCADVSNSTESSCRSVNGSLTPYGQEQVGGEQHCTYTTPSGLLGSASACSSGANVSTALTSNLAISKLNASSVSSQKDPIQSLLEVAFFRFPMALRSSAAGGPCKLFPPTVSECKFSWCVKKFSSRFSQGVLHDQVVDTEAIKFGPEQVYEMERHAGKLRKYWMSVTAFGLYTAGAEATPSIYAVPGFLAKDFPAVWNGYTKSRAMYFYLTGRNASVIADSPDAIWINIADALDMLTNLQTVLNVDLDTHLQSKNNAFLSQKLYSLLQKNASLAMENLATSLTRAIRQGPNSTEVDGLAYTDETFVDVRWPWLILPVALVLLAALFFGLCVIFSGEKSQIVWKSSCLPALFHGLQGWSSLELSNRRLTDIDNCATNMYAILEDFDGGRMALRRRAVV